MTTALETVVIGAGIVGAAAAFSLTGLGARVTVIDVGLEGRATAAGAGILSPETTSHEDPAYQRFALAAGRHVAKVARELGTDRVGYGEAPLLVVAMDDDDPAVFRGVAERLLAPAHRDRVEAGAKTLREVEEGEARRLFPPLGRVRGAIMNARAARVDGRLLADGLLAAARERGARSVNAAVRSLRLDEGSGGTVLVRTDGATIRADRIVLAGGAWSCALGQELGLPIPVEPQRGQIVHLRTPQGSGMDATATGDWAMVDGLRGHYMLPWPDGRVTAGATRELGSGAGVILTAAGELEVLREALRVAPGLAPWEIAEWRVGLRPRSPDNLPILGAALSGRVVIATGHGAGGLLAGPYSGHVAARLVCDIADAWEGQSEARDAFSPDRFGRASASIRGGTGEPRVT